MRYQRKEKDKATQAVAGVAAALIASYVGLEILRSFGIEIETKREREIRHWMFWMCVLLGLLFWYIIIKAVALWN